MTKDEALKMAIEFASKAGSLSGEQYYVARDKLINACKEALKPHPDCDEACMFQCQMEKKHNQWQGLTDDEIDKLGWMDYMNSEEQIELVREIEQALKEKNK